MSQSKSEASSRCWLTVIVFVLTIGHSPVSASEPTSPSSVAPEERYRVLQWQDLVPNGWQRPLIAKAYNADAAIDEASVVKELDGQLAALPGYMQPLVFQGNRVTEFLLVPFLPHRAPLAKNKLESCAHPHFEPNQQVYVYALEPVVVENPFKPIWIVGAMSLEPVMAESGPVAYRMDDAVTTPYQY